MFLDTGFLSDGEITLRLLYTGGADPQRDWVPYYHFIICSAATDERMGSCSLRVGYSESIYYCGHIGYQVDAPFRGHGYAYKASRLLFQLARKHEMHDIIITCNPDNIPSRKTCERLDGTLEAIVDVPVDSDLYLAGDHQKCVFRYVLMQ